MQSANQAKYGHGYTLLDDPEKCQDIESLYTQGYSQKEITARAGVSESTVVTMLRQAREQGRCASLRDRLIEFAIDSCMGAINKARELRESLSGESRADMVSAVGSYEKSAWIGVGILSDKLAASTPSVQISAGPGSVIQVVNDYSQKLAQFTPKQAQVNNELAQLIDVQASVTEHN